MQLPLEISERIIGVINEAIREKEWFTARDLVRVTADTGLAISESLMACNPARYGVGCQADKILLTDLVK